MFKVSVIIPVYNAAKFVSKAVESAVNLSEVAEVILIEDGSPDGALEICLGLANLYDKVVLFQHPNGANLGAGASRNLGIEKASCDFVSFLDADDWYSPHRFKKDEFIFSTYTEADASYSCTILEEDQYYPERRYGITSDPRAQWGRDINPLKFYELHLKNRWVLFHTNGITVKKSFLIQDKYFDTRLALHQDSELWNRLLRRGNFHAAEWEQPVAVIRRHSANRIIHRSSESISKMLAILIENIGVDNLYKFEKIYFLNQFSRIESKKYNNRIVRKFMYYFLKSLSTFRRERVLRLKVRKHAIN